MEHVDIFKFHGFVVNFKFFCLWLENIFVKKYFFYVFKSILYDNIKNIILNKKYFFKKNKSTFRLRWDNKLLKMF